MTEPDAGNERLERAGIPADSLSAAQHELVSDLSDDELATLSQVSAGLRAARAAKPKPKPGDGATGVFYY